MANKKKHKLKKSVKVVVVVLVVLIIGVLGGLKAYKTYKYHQTNEYKLLMVGYSNSEVEDILSKLNENQIETLLTQVKNETLVSIINAKYFMLKNYEKYLEYEENNTSTSIDDVIAIVNVGANKEWYDGVKTTDVSKGQSMLVNKFNLLPEDFVVEDIKEFSSTYAYGTVSASIEAYDAFIEMANAAKKEDITLVLTSGYRSYESQEKTYNSMVKSKGQTYADEYAARPGASEHETGLALDMVSNGKYIYTNNFKESPAYEWLSMHAHEYGFIERYPEGKEYLTGYEPESWHYRYLGVELATKVKNEGITYDEYYAYYLDEQ